MNWAIYSVIAYISGVCLSAFLPSKFVLLLCIVFLLILIWYLRKVNLAILIAVIVAFVSGTMSYPFFDRKSEILKTYFTGENIMVAKVTDITETDRLLYTVKLINIKNEQKSVNFSGKIYVYAPEDVATKFKRGDILTFKGKLSFPAPKMNFGGFNSERYYRSLGIYAFCNEPEFIKVSRGRFSLTQLMGNISDFSSGILKTRIGGENANFISGVLLGDRSSFSEDLTQNIRKTGVSHITAVSGMHVSILTLFLLYITNIFTKKRRTKALFILVVLFLYMIITGMSPSVVRAVIMSGCSMIGVIINRRGNTLFMVALAATVMLIINPYLLYNSSFMLSFISTASICLFFPVIKSHSKSGKLDTLYMTLIANFATLPYVLWNFHTYSWIGLIINLIIVPLIPFVFIGGGLTVIFGALPVIGTIISFFTRGITSIVLVVINYTSHLSFGQINYKLGNPLYIIAYILFAIIIYGLLSKTPKIKCGLCTLAIVLVMSAGIYFDYNKNSSFYINYMYVGQGDSALINTPGGKKFLIDTGDTLKSGKSLCLDALKNLGVTKLEGIIISHFDNDHSGALTEIIESIPVKYVYISENALNYGEAEEITTKIGEDKIKGVSRGDSFKINDVAFEFLHPADSGYTSSNEDSIVLNVNYNGKNFMFTGDIPAKVEREIAHYMPDCDTIKVAHHGSQNSTTEEFLEAVSPESAIISCGISNNYYHPSGEVIDRLKSYNIKTYVTSINGAVRLNVLDNRIKIKTVIS